MPGWRQLLVGVALASLAPISGCWSYTHVFTPATSHAGHMGYGTLEHVRGQWLIFATTETHVFMTGMAGASGDGATVLSDGRTLLDGVWRVQPPGHGRTTLAMMFCRGDGPTADCADVTFDRPDGVQDRGFLSIIDPINRGALLVVQQTTGLGASGQAVTTVTGRGQLTVHDGEDAIEPALGVWVAPEIGTLFHCAVETAGPHCRPAMLDGAPLRHGVTRSVQSVRRGGGLRAHVIWETGWGRDPVRCEVLAPDPTPRCVEATMEGR